MRNSQLLLFSHPGLEYGGSARLGRRKIQRPFDRKRPMHLVFRSSKARGPWSFLHRRHKEVIRGILGELCQRFAVKLHSFENVGSHLHLVVKIPGRRELRAFLRVFAQRVMFAVTGARKGDPKGRFFDGVAYSKVVNFGGELRELKNYLSESAREALGVLSGDIRAWQKTAKEVPS